MTPCDGLALCGPAYWLGGLQLGFRQGSPRDAEMMQALFGQEWMEDLTRYSNGNYSTRHVERPRVSIDVWLNGLHPGDAWLKVAPIDRGWRQERVRVAMPKGPKLSSETTPRNYPRNHVRDGARVVSEEVVSAAPEGCAPYPDMSEARGALRAAPLP